MVAKLDRLSRDVHFISGSGLMGVRDARLARKLEARKDSRKPQLEPVYEDCPTPSTERYRRGNVLVRCAFSFQGELNSYKNAGRYAPTTVHLCWSALTD